MASKNKLLTLVFVIEKSRILLGLKKRGFGVGRWNGFGGKVEKQETIEEAAKRRARLNEAIVLSVCCLHEVQTEGHNLCHHIVSCVVAARS